MPDFLTYYNSLRKRQKTALNKLIKDKTDISSSTLWRKANNVDDNDFSNLEKEAISNILEQPVEVLFPAKKIMFPSYK